MAFQKTATYQLNSTVSSQPIGTLIASIWENPDIIPKKYPNPLKDLV